MSAANIELRHYVPSDMSRKPRGLADLDRWKASEFRLFLLYAGPVVLKSTIPDSLRDNFMTLHCAVSILCSPSSCAQYLDYAERLLAHFVETYIVLYGRHAVSHNVHGLIHVADDVRVHGCLHGYSAFPFENYMSKLKDYMRKPERPLEQLYNRIMEERKL
uniref:PrC protein, putative n=1 Tax=Ixodes scapularis TaxID=6945 RepID=A0A1S4L4W9_IXOSC